MPSIRTLQTFLATVRLGSFAAAGQDVGLTSAAVGLQIRALEEELGVALFDRSARAAVLNTEGRQRVPVIKELVERWQQLQVQPGQGELGGTVVMGALVSALMGAFADALWKLKRQHPGLEVTLLAGQSADFMTRVERGELDAAVVTQSPTRLTASLGWTPLYTEPRVLIVPTRPHCVLMHSHVHNAPQKNWSTTSACCPSGTPPPRRSWCPKRRVCCGFAPSWAP